MYTRRMGKALWSATGLRRTVLSLVVYTTAVLCVAKINGDEYPSFTSLERNKASLVSELLMYVHALMLPNVQYGSVTDCADVYPNVALLTVLMLCPT